MYVAVKGGEKAIKKAHELLAKERRGALTSLELEIEQIKEQLSLAVDRVMAEGSLYDKNLAALAIKQARGDLVEAIFLLRAYRTTLMRFGTSQALNTEAMQIKRRISATYKDIPGGQVLGATFDYTHRLLDMNLMQTSKESAKESSGNQNNAGLEKDINSLEPLLEENNYPKVLSFLEKEKLLQTPNAHQQAENSEAKDLTRDPLTLPAGRDLRLQNLARADEGLLLALAYSTQRGFGSTHPFVGEIRIGIIEVSFIPEELGFEVVVGEITITECETVNKFQNNKSQEAYFTRGYGLAFGENERKTISMALVDRSLQSKDLGEEIKAPAQDEEFVLYHSDNVEASGFVQHLKLPHYVDFQAELSLVRALNATNK
ncbi:carbon-phosphorus lyase complex subunit PhnI [Desulfovibrio litoralis]|uniref:Alpha-D-ribose 1-methylphosphonate 5-triphosphate synthase subunit PhnI n=1 Tax=Desulfovibrio litoralis DSM 11393 TaxID=1121455 RepID=A0A1M7SSR4_9BACT|nr:carbon-phosphorus lyase complex subunit PhnI [Desulfovibrio litoralis]SHN61555.1 alpha-D-ribose 1-methylphosphonate 5-triphosphate synthase subunit PhnI [Desulfovibrio litoralis DSM 11393]